MNLADYDLTTLAQLRHGEDQGVNALAGGLLSEMAEAFGCPLHVVPIESEIRTLISVVAPSKELQANGRDVVTVIGRGNEAAARIIATGWLERSGIMEAVKRSFVRPATGGLPECIDYVVLRDGTPNWMLRRQQLALRLSPYRVDTVVLLAGNDTMKLDDHELVRTWYREHGEQLPTRQQFADKHIAPGLRDAGFKVRPLWVESDKGRDHAMAFAEAYPDARTKTVLVAGNAGEAIQGTGQFRNYVGEKLSGFDRDITQLWMMSDSFPIATRADQSKDFYQNPLTGIGNIPRAALNVFRAGLEFASA
jgi:hypothetical protein